MSEFPLDALISRGKYDLEKIHDWHHRYFGETATLEKMAKEKLKYQEARTTREQFEVEELKGALIRTEKVKEDLGFVFFGLKQRLTSWSRSLPPKIAHKDERGAMKVLEDEVWFILEELSQGVKRIIKLKKKGRKK